MTSTATAAAIFCTDSADPDKYKDIFNRVVYSINLDGRGPLKRPVVPAAAPRQQKESPPTGAAYYWDLLTSIDGRGGYSILGAIIMIFGAWVRSRHASSKDGSPASNAPDTPRDLPEGLPPLPTDEEFHG